MYSKKYLLTNFFFYIFIVLFSWWVFFNITFFLKDILLFHEIFFFISNLKITDIPGFFKILYKNTGAYLWFSMILFISIKIGLSILTKFKMTLNFLEKFGFSAGIGFGLISYIMLTAGFMKLYYSALFKIIIIVIFCFFLKNQLKKWKTGFNFNFKFNLNFSVFQYLIALSILPSVLFVIIMSISPEIFYDSLVYHLAVPDYYISHHKILRIDYLMHSDFPSGQQMLYCLALLTGNEITAKLIHSFMYFCGAAVCFSSCKKILFSNTGYIAAGLILSLPILTVNSWTCGNDAALAFYFILALCAVLNYLHTNELKYFLIAIIFCGLCFTIKYTSMLSVSGLVIFLIIYSVYIKKKKFTAFIKYSSAAALILFLLFAPWLIKNYLLTGNPIYPFFQKITNDYQLKNVDINSGSVIYKFNTEDFNIKKMLLFFWGNSMSDKLGGITILCLLPCLFFYGKIDRYLIILSGAFCVSYIFWFFTVPEFRFFIPSLILLIIILSRNFDVFSRTFKPVKLLLLLLISINVLVIEFQMFNSAELYHYFSGKINIDGYLSAPKKFYYSIPPYKALKWCNENLSENDKIMMIGESRAFYLKIKHFWHSVEGNKTPLIELLKKSNNETEFANNLIFLNITHLLINYNESIRTHKMYNVFYWSEKDKIIFNNFWKKYIKLEYYKSGTYIYKIDFYKKDCNNYPPNFFEYFEKHGWKTDNFIDFCLKNNLYKELIDELEILQYSGYNYSETINYYKKKIEYENR